MDVGAEPHVVGEVPTDVVGVIVDDDVIVVPEPVAHIIIVVRRDGEEIAADVEAVTRAAAEPPDALRTNRAGEVAMLPRPLEMVVRVVPAAVVSDPGVVGSVDVRRRGMVGPIAIRGSSGGRGARGL